MILNIAKHCYITTEFQFTGTERNRTGTGNNFNLIMRITVEWDDLTSEGIIFSILQTVLGHLEGIIPSTRTKL